MSADPTLARTTLFDPERDWALDPGLAELAFGSRVRRRDAGAPSHLAFLSQESLEIDLGDPRQREFGDYELLEQIGQGGMGVVYRARQAGLEREVAVKLLSAGPWASPEFVARFQREAQAAARMQHPNIVAIHETGVHGDLNFFSMQLVHGGSLANRLAADGPMAPRAAAELLRTVAEAVDYAHRLDVLHLDIKPGNVLIDGNGKPQVADFGLARRIGELISVDRQEVSGTPSYMSPEQVRGETGTLSPATDIYGLGALLYECLTGKPPFNARNAQATLSEVLSAPPRAPSQLRGNIPADLEAICLKCLAKEPAARYRGARDLADDLNRFLEAREVKARPLGAGGRLLRLARREPRLTALALLLVCTLVVGIGATALQWRRAENNAAASRALLWESRRGEALQLERDGRGFEAVPRLLANLREQDQAGNGADAALERRRMGLVQGQGAVLVDRMVVADANPLAVAVSEDGRWLALGLSDQSVRWYDAATLVERGRVSFRDRKDAIGEPAVPRLLRFTPDGRLRVTLDWMSNQVSPAEGDTWLVDLARAQVIEPPPGFAGFADATFDADGQHALLRDAQRRTQLWQVSPWRALGPRAVADTEQFLPWLLGPQGRFAAHLATGMVHLRVVDPATSRPAPILPLPGNAGVSAWSLAHDGRWLALGDFEGRVYLVDPASGEHRQLPAPRSREVTWLEFSEDDAWLAVGTRDGAAQAYDVATGDPLVSGQMQHDFALLRVAVSHRQRLLIASGRGNAALWRLPEPGPRAVPAQRIGAAPVAHAQAADYALGWSLSTGLLASAGLDGDVQLWRLPTGPTVDARAAAQVPDGLRFDGRHLVDVAWDQVRVVSVDGREATRWQALAQPPGFAELIAQGRQLLVATGTELQRLDARTLAPLGPALRLEDSPSRLAVSADGRWAVVTRSVNAGDGTQEALRLLDLRRGAAVGNEIRVAGPLRRLAISADGGRLLALGPADGALSVFSLPRWQLLGERPQDDTQPIAWADFDADGAISFVTRAPDPRFGRDLAARWDPATDALRWQGDAGAVQPLGVIAASGGLFVAGRGGDLWFGRDGRPRALPRLARSESTAVLATSADGRLLAHAFVREVQLHDAATGAPIGLPLVADSDANDVIVQLAFPPDGQRLLARSAQGHWRQWWIGADLRSPAGIARGLAHVATPASGVVGLRLPTAADRAALRRQDPGPWQAAPARPQPALIPGHLTRVPPRTPGLAPELVDLSRLYNFDPDMVRNRFFSVRAQMRPLPAGLLRIGGIDFDARGMSQVGTSNMNQRTLEEADFRPRICAAFPAGPVAAVHLLLQVSTPSPTPTGDPLATLHWRYVDGSEASTSLRAGIELPGYDGDDADVPRVLAIDAARTVVGDDDPGLSSPRAANPHPDRPLRCVSVASLRPTLPFVLLAMTVERAHDAGQALAVIGGADSRTGLQAGATGPAKPSPPRAQEAP